MLTQLGRREWPHLSESSRSPRRIGAARVGEGDLLGVLLVARRGSGEVEVWRWVENELGGSFYSQSEAVAENGITPAMITARQRTVRWIRELGITARVHWFRSSAKLGLPWVLLHVPNGTAHGTRRRHRACAVLLRPWRRCRSVHRQADSHAEATGGLGGAGRRRRVVPIPAGRHGWLCHRRSCRRRRDASPPTMVPVQTSVRCSG